ncbi:protein kinase family protein [Anaerobacillus sp. MEB173]|uniref:protein kinase family protein n=1 Tax=Anaerobacillus sp. MEB173 TaxID=3383345 RepID=UPI003F8F1B20
MKYYNSLAQSVKYSTVGSTIRLNEKGEKLDLIGKGRSAFVFRIRGTTKVLKVFFPSYINIAKEEAEVYISLIDNPYFPVLYEYGPNYLVIDYIEGNTLFHCLLKGVTIKSYHIREIDHALQLARDNGLNPSDIHLRNIILTPAGSIKIIDVARFRQKKICSQWNDLKTVFYRYYKHQWFPKKVPAFLLNLAAFLYKKNVLHRFLFY